ncbi:hypothetical protein AVEN_207944-1, partial [Araneus ventricosus]
YSKKENSIQQDFYQDWKATRMVSGTCQKSSG